MEVIKILIFSSLIVTSLSVNKDPLAITSSVFEQLSEIAQSDAAKLFLRNITPLLEKSVPLVGTLIAGGLSIAGVATDDTSGKLEEILEKLEMLDKIYNKFDEIKDQSYRMEKLISNEHDRTIGLLKMERIIPIMTKMLADEDKLPSLIVSFVNNSKVLEKKLEEFNSNYEKENYEINLVNHLLINISDYRSIMQEKSYVGQKYQTNQLSPRGLKSSIQKSIYDLFLTMFMTIIRGFQVHKIATGIQNKFSNESDTSTLEYIIQKEKATLKKFFESLNDTFETLNDEDDVSSFIDFAEAPKDPVKFRLVFQPFFEVEHVFTGECRGSCGDVKSKKINDDFCKGIVRKCESVNNLKIDYVAYPRSERIYHGFKYNDKKWCGLGSEEKSKSFNTYASWSDFSLCEYCKCTCDQENNPLTLRRVYVGKFEAPDGFVITGVRFKEDKKAIYLQPQVGKLLPMGSIKSNSIYWMEIPSNARSNDFLTINYDDESSYSIMLGLNHKKFPGNQVVTGIQLTRVTRATNRDDLRLEVFGKTLSSFKEGTLESDEFKAENVINSGFTHIWKNLGRKVGIMPNNNNFNISKEISFKFQQSDEESDGGQSFVPYFDAAEVTFDQPAPLSMIGIVHYTNDDKYAGYIRPVIKSLDYKKFI